jgi:uncharacterized small protein (DUF1192 family)
MPILRRPEGSDLLQGDILKGVPLHFTSKKLEAFVRAAPYAMVLSRDCSAVHKAVSLATVHLLKDIKLERGARDLDSVVSALDVIRDGAASPDRFYIGAIEGHRHAAHLDEISTLELPTNDAERAEWVRERRVWSLEEDFRFALRARLNWTFSRPGYDDLSWYCVEDLDAVLAAADGELQKLKAECAAKVAEHQAASLSGLDPKTLEAGVKKAQEAVAKYEAKIKSFLDERGRRPPGA